MHLVFYHVILLIPICACQRNLNNKTDLFFSYITTKTVKGTGFVASGAIPLVDWALEQINNSSTILPGYHLKYNTIEDSQVLIHSYVYTYINHESPKYHIVAEMPFSALLGVC